MGQRFPSKKRKQAGFTLIELLVASILLVVGVTAMASLIALAVKNNGHSRLDSSATMLNQAVMEQVISGIQYQSFPSSSGTANIYDCGTHTSTPWVVNSTLGGANLDSNGNIDFSQDLSAVPAGYSMTYVSCSGTNTYEVRWNISALNPTTTSLTHILTVGSRIRHITAKGGTPGGPTAAIIDFPINMRVMLGPDPPPGT
jgi:type II secretory pathway pseudopilin PulG